MTGWNPQLARLRQQLAQVALTPGADLAERSAAALEALGRVLPSDAAWPAVRDPEARRPTPLATTGAGEPLRAYFQTPEADAEVDALGLNRHRPPMLAGEIPMPLPELRAWAEHLLPAGFRGGLTAGLFTPGGRHIGFLSLLSEDPARPGSADRDVIAAGTAVLAHALVRAPGDPGVLAATSGVLAHALARTPRRPDTARIVEAASAPASLTRTALRL